MEGDGMGEGICLGFESAQMAWRQVGWRIAESNPADDTRPPLLVRILFYKGSGLDLSPMPERTRIMRAPARVDPGAYEALRERDAALAAGAHLCVSRRRGRRHVAGARTHLVSGRYPPGAFFRLANDVLVASPELTFLQMARTVDLMDLVVYGFEICGYYARGGPSSFVNCPALTSVARIATFLDRVERLRKSRGEGMPWGMVAARRALACVRDGAASPEEAVVTIVLSMPSRLGGYGIPAPALNGAVRLSTACADLFGIDSFVCDLSWNGGQHVLEYQGTQHKLRSRRRYDLRKGNVLVADGRDVIEMNRDILKAQGLMDEVAKSLTRVLGRRWRRPSAEIATRRIRLRNRLIADLNGPTADEGAVF